ncbi:hypothetical protein G6F56_002669 [Rhizopus delemar]|nr:hypothetical protein G6F56_002669 [Rhizopus delemar]
MKGYSLYQAAKSINFPESTMRKCVHCFGDSREGTNSEFSIHGRIAPGLIMANHSQFIENLVERRSECTLEEVSLLLQEEFPKDFERSLSVSAVHKHLISKLNFTLKKAEVYSERRNHEEIRQKRYDYVNKIVTEERVHYGQNCVFVDETGFNLNVNRTQARARRNEPARIVVPSSSKGRNVSIFGAISHRGVELLAKHIRCMVQPGATTFSILSTV